MSTAAMSLPIYRDHDGTTTLPTFDFTAASSSTTTSPNTAAYNSSPFRPAISSPLSSSPIRMTSTTLPLSPRDLNAGRFRDTQSSPIHYGNAASKDIFGSSNNNSGNTSKFASRPTRPTPFHLKREAAQESRRKLFLKNVRQKAEDKRWEMRGGENELLKLEWFSLNRELRSAKNADSDGLILDSDIEEAARLREEVMRHPIALETAERTAAHSIYDADAMMVDMLEQEQQAELEAMMASAPENGQPSSSTVPTSMMKPPDSPHLSDDDAEYDAFFEDFLSSQEALHGQDQDADMDLS